MVGYKHFAPHWFSSPGGPHGHLDIYYLTVCVGPCFLYYLVPTRVTISDCFYLVGTCTKNPPKVISELKVNEVNIRASYISVISWSLTSITHPHTKPIILKVYWETVGGFQ